MSPVCQVLLPDAIIIPLGLTFGCPNPGRSGERRRRRRGRRRRRHPGRQGVRVADHRFVRGDSGGGGGQLGSEHHSVIPSRYGARHAEVDGGIVFTVPRNASLNYTTGVTPIWSPDRILSCGCKPWSTVSMYVDTDMMTGMLQIAASVDYKGKR